MTRHRSCFCRFGALGRGAAVCVFAVASASAARASEVDLLATQLPPLRLEQAGLAGTVKLPSAALSSAARPASSSLVLPEKHGFYRGYLLPRMTLQLDRMRAYSGVPTSGQALGEFVLLDDVTGAAQQRAERGMRRAVKNYLLDTTGVGRWIQSFGTESSRTPSGAPRANTRAFRTGFGISHGLPRAEMRYGAGRTFLRLGVGADQTVGFEVRRDGHTSGAALSARYDWDENTYSLGCRISF
jgi:hypothetical protein